MGSQVLAAVCRDPDLEPVAVLEKFAPESSLPLPDGSGQVPFGPDPAALLRRTHPDVVIDFTHAEWTPTVARAALANGSRLVIGTTGLSQAFLEELAETCRQTGLGAVVAPNFAIGAILMMHLAKIAAPFFDYAEVIEMHQEKKADAPSGTAIATARAMAEAREKPFTVPPTYKETVPGTRGAAIEGVSIHSVRLPGLVAHQEVILGGLGQTLIIRHDSTSRESFIPGVLLATKEVMSRNELVVGLDKLLGLS